MKVYFISGLAADKRVFKYVLLPQGFEAVYLDWITPLKDESLRDYALRLAEGIDISRPFAILGLSMGGMIASEISRQYKPAATIIISSIPAASHLPSYIRLGRKLNIHKMIPVRLVKFAAIIKRSFTTESPDDKIVLKNMIKESDNNFIRWSIYGVMKWENERLPSPYIHIHGTHDEVLPIYFTKPTHIIAKGGHLMIMNRSAEINQIIGNTLMSL